MNKERLENEYFDWMYEKVRWWSDDISYRKLLRFLHGQIFYYLIERDDNRYADGIGLRYLFGNTNGYSQAEIASYLDDKECSVLEMMVALSNRCENDIMTRPDEDDRTGFWFMGMIKSLGLSNMDDRNFNLIKANDILERFLERKYEPNGKGGLFTLRCCEKDLTKVEIWYQLMWYLHEVNEKENLL